jgi:glycosyltransferase involved in cell wall biosynthesis
MLFPIEWDEPFGLVVGESMACGTPVIAFRRGAMPELISHGKTGYLCDNVDDMVSAIGAIDQLDRRACRAAVIERFAPDVIAKDYEKLYYSLLSRSAGDPGGRVIPIANGK